MRPTLVVCAVCCSIAAENTHAATPPGNPKAQIRLPALVAASVYGDREKSVAVYIGDGMGGATEAFSDFVYGATIDGEGPAAKLWLTLPAEQCGMKPAVDCASENFCDRALVWNAQTKQFQYAPVSTVRMLQ